MPLPCKSATFSATVICFRTSSARFSGESPVFIQGWSGLCVEAVLAPFARQKQIERIKLGHNRGGRIIGISIDLLPLSKLWRTLFSRIISEHGNTALARIECGKPHRAQG